MIELTEEYLDAQEISTSALSRFWFQVRKTDTCWNWFGATGNHGYGVIQVTFQKKRTLWLTHRFSYTVNTGIVPDKMCVLHRCDNRRCVKPDHFFIGDRVANVADMVSKLRHKPCPLKGSEIYCSKLNDDKVIEIRKQLASGKLIKELAVEFSVRPGTIRFIQNGRTWKHLLQA